MAATNIKIRKTYTFEAAHRLGLGYVGKCADNHGHSYKATIEIRGFVLNEHTMVVDFGDLAPLKQKIKERFDHKTILHKDDPLGPWLEEDQGPGSVTYFDVNPTCEAIAVIIFEMTIEVLEELFPGGKLRPGDLSMAPTVTEVRVQETDTGFGVVQTSNVNF